jgi:hypothetical protein
MGLIFIPKLTTKHLYFLFFSISSFLRDYTYLIDIEILGKIKDIEKNQTYIAKRHFDIITNVLSDCLQGIIVLFSKIKNRKSSQEENQKVNPSHERLYDIFKKSNSSFYSFFKIMTQISGLDFFCQLLFLIFAILFNNDGVIERKNYNFLLIIDILSRFLFCRVILDTYFYKHHIVSMIINFIVFLILGSFDIYSIFFQKGKDFKEVIFFFSFLIIMTIAYSLEDVLNKIALSRESLTPYSLLFYKGLMQIPFVIITSICLMFIDDYKPFTILSDMDKHLLIRRGLFVIFNIFRSIFLVKVIDKFSSQHLSILKVLESLFMFVYFLLNGDYEGNLLLIFVILISFLILTFTSLVYNEILVINLWGLQDYTQHGLDIQAEKDLRDAVTEISELSSDVSEVSNSKSESFIIKNVSYAD